MIQETHSIEFLTLRLAQGLKKEPLLEEKALACKTKTELINFVEEISETVKGDAALYLFNYTQMYQNSLIKD